MPRGLRKFRSIEESSAYREAWEDEAMRQRAAYFQDLAEAERSEV